MKRTKPVAKKRTKKPTTVGKKRTKKPTRKRIRPSKQLFLCSRAPAEIGGKCWFTGNCPHREPHTPVIKNRVNLCEHGFCSLMKLSCGCRPVK